MNISLPESMRDWVVRQTQSGHYANNSDVVRDLIRKEQQRQEKVKALQLALEKGLASGIAEDFDMEQLIQRINNG